MVHSSINTSTDQTLETEIGTGHIYRTIRALHTFSTEIWDARNTQLHKRNDEEAARIRTPIDAVIKELHQQPHLLHPTDRFRCETPLSDIIKLRPPNKRRWVRRVQQAQQRLIETSTHQQTSLPTFQGYSITSRQRTPLLPTMPKTTTYTQTTLTDTPPPRQPPPTSLRPTLTPRQPMKQTQLTFTQSAKN